MGGEEGASSPNAVTSPLCEECGQSPWKYRCPGCSIRTCSLPCVKSHKQRSGCTGQRDRTQIIPLSQFDDNQLLSDYNLLEETKRSAEAARRMRRLFGEQPGGTGWRRGRFGGPPCFKLPFKLRMLRSVALRRKARLLLQPTGMSKREKNQTRYDHRTKSIFWTIEWRFHSTDVILTDHSVDERVNLISIMAKHLTPTPWNHQLRPFCNEELENLKFFLQKNPKDPKSPFRELNIRIPIGQQMSAITIVEYPVILVFLPTQRYDFNVEVNRSFHKNVKNEDDKGDEQSPKHSLFKEEEPEDNDVSCDTRILDLMDYINSESCDKPRIAEGSSLPERTATLSNVDTPKFPAESSRAVSGIQDQPCGGEENNGNPNCSSSSLRLGADFDFEQGLRDVYSHLLGEINPDDFLCFDGDHGECEMEGDNVVGYCGGELIESELEEGEIPDH